ncbi:MAG TPA: ABC transporter permease subunit [Vicinamibacterales bacterium]|nr:ABC transporter permease subunit [Vicinamibacterales bacterium]
MTESVRSQMASAARRIARLKRIDRAAVFVITLGGLSVVVGVLGILIFVAAEAVPLFRSATVRPEKAVTLSPPAPTDSRLTAIAVDEYRKYISYISADARVVFRDAVSGAAAFEIPVPGLPPGTPVRSSSSSLLGNVMAAGTADGRVALMQAAYSPRYENDKLIGLDVKVVERGVAQVDPAKRPIEQVSYSEIDGQKNVAAIVGDRDVALWRSDDAGTVHQKVVQIANGQRVVAVRVGRRGSIVAASDTGRLYHWLYDEDEPRLTDVVTVADEPITALDYLIGGASIVVGTRSGGVTAWFRAAAEGGQDTLLRAHVYESQGSSVLAFAPSPRDRSFAVAGADGLLTLRHQTSERTLARVPHAVEPGGLLISPKADAIYNLHGGTLAPLAVSNPHPEVSWGALFGKVWYEGYAQAEYVWQSTGASDDFEPKLSLVPLVFGTLKGTLYAMLFAIPIAVLAALYTSQFVHPSIKAKVKPTVEIMAALPSVVIGFIAGLYLAAMVERNLVAVFVMMLAAPVFGTSGIVFWRLLPPAVAHRLRAGAEVLLILPLLVLAAWFSWMVAPYVEAWFFAGDARTWLQANLGLTYDQRNCLVVGIAMGFAVIPIIFTIAEDAFTSVPSSLTAASLALGASRWQTAVRVVLPTASPGVFSAIMIGFGRAIGETMIVLMATGNTPVMDWSIFNGIRTLSANIAVEIPEAPHGGTLYRTLFLAAALLFAITFIINTIAEVIRQRLRERYKAV